MFEVVDMVADKVVDCFVVVALDCKRCHRCHRRRLEPDSEQTKWLFTFDFKLLHGLLTRVGVGIVV